MSITPGRHHRQEILPQIGAKGQARLAASDAVIVGVGALGCAAADLLARAGVGGIRLIDRDIVERTNLQRQTLFTERDAAEAMPKAEAARRRLLEIDGALRVEAEIADVTAANAERLLVGGGAGAGRVLLDGTDNYETRYLINDVAVKHGAGLIYGGAVATRGMAMPVVPGGPCLRCVFPEPPPPEARETCDTAGVLNAVTAMVGALQASLALRWLLGALTPEDATLSRIDAWLPSFSASPLAGMKDPGCPCCGLGRFEFLGGARGSAPATLCGRSAVQVAPQGAEARLDLGLLEARLAAHGGASRTPFLLRASLREEALTLTVFADGRAIVHGTTDAARARSIYARYIGA